MAMSARERARRDLQASKFDAWVDDSQESVRKSWAMSLRAAFSPNGPGFWSQDHYEQAQHFTGWNYVAIRAIALQFMKARVSVYADLDEAETAYAKNIQTYSRDKCYTISRNINKSFDDSKVNQKQLPKTHRLCQLLNRPSPWQSGASFRYEQAVQLGLTGVNLIWMAPNKFGLTKERYVIPTCLATPIPPNATYNRGGWKITPLTNYNGYDDGFVDVTGYSSVLGRTIAAEYVEVIRWPHPMYKGDGYGPLAGGSQWSDTADQIDRSRWSQLKNALNPSLMVSPGADTELTQGDMDRLSEQMNAKYAGADKVGRVMIAPPGTEVTAVSKTAVEMAYEQAWSQMQAGILGLHGVPPTN